MLNILGLSADVKLKKKDIFLRQNTVCVCVYVCVCVCVSKKCTRKMRLFFLVLKINPQKEINVSIYTVCPNNLRWTH